MNKLTDITNITDITSASFGGGGSVAGDYALQFLAANTDDIVLPLSIDSSSDWFVEWMVKYTEFPPTESRFGIYESSKSFYHGLQAARIRVAIDNNSINSVDVINSLLNTWIKIRVEFTQSTSSIALYVNDIFQSSVAINGSSWTIANWHIGKYTVNGNPANAGDLLIDYFNFNDELVLNFNEGSGTTTKDTLGNSYTIISDRANPNDMWVEL